ncbi:hypothetical protein AB8O64_20990 [Streptomyces sp. QH1-20]|uniref:hypothetical protein n=1 Tax=Streptomyces sp. QH1-20 TaxID=3240934 RepID=UPI003519D042
MRVPRRCPTARKELRRVRQRCESVLDALDLPRPFTMNALLDHLSRRRDRPVVVQPLPGVGGPGAPCGLWLATGTTDYICFEPSTSPLHREQIIFHECAHVLFGHRLGADLPGIGELLPDLGPSLIRRALGRTTYTNTQEAEAEMLASLLSLHSTGHTTRAPDADDDMAARVVDSVRRLLRGGP